jgi:hypothetical protein
MRHILVRTGICLVASLALLYLCDIPSSRAVDAPIWQALLLDGDDADPSEVRTLAAPPGDQPAFASACPEAAGGRCAQRAPASIVTAPHGFLSSSVPARAPPAA